MTYRIEVLCKRYSMERGDFEEWRPVRPTGSDKPYEWQTEREADAMRGLCYDARPWEARVVKVLS